MGSHQHNLGSRRTWRTSAHAGHLTATRRPMPLWLSAAVLLGAAIALVSALVAQSVVAAQAVPALISAVSQQDEVVLDSAQTDLWDDLDREKVGAYAAPPGRAIVPSTQSDPVDSREYFDIESPDSLTVLVNKQLPVTPLHWEPSDLRLPEGIPNAWNHVLRADAAAALERMHAEAVSAGLHFNITSGFRSHDTQAGLYSSYAELHGQESADTFSARAGYSEHQTGLAVDVDDGSGCYMQTCFGQTPTGQWLAKNAHRFGFILRHEEGTAGITGYDYEPWHFRYVGEAVARSYWESGATSFEEFLNQEPAPTY